MKKIYTKIKREKKDTVADFLLKFTRAVVSWTGPSPAKTYHDPKCTIIQCRKGSSRSLDDLYRIARTKFPRLTYKKFSISLMEVVYKEQLYFILCGDINRWVLRNSSGNGAHFKKLIGKYQDSEYRFYEKGIGKYTLAETFINAGIDPTTFPPQRKIE